MRLQSVFEQQKGSGLAFFRLWSQNQKKASPDQFHENMVRKVFTANMSINKEDKTSFSHAYFTFDLS